jgi:cytochrome P450
LHIAADIPSQYAAGLIEDVISGKSKDAPKDCQSGMDDHPTIFHRIVNSDLPPEDKEPTALFENTRLFLFAGFETTGFTLTLATYHVLANPSIKRCLKQELDSAWPNVEEIPAWADLEKVPLLNAVVKEALRLGTGVLTRLPRINHKRPIQYEGWSIPPGTPVSMSQPLIHYNPDIFPRPLEFDPDRWLRAEDSKKLDRFLVPFSKGSRGCIGSQLAMAELHIALATVFRRFDMELDNASLDDIASYHGMFIPVPKSGQQELSVKVL